MSSCRSITSTHTPTRRGSKCVVARKVSQIVVAGVGVLLLCLPAFSQLNSGSIAGSIADQSGAVIPGEGNHHRCGTRRVAAVGYTFRRAILRVGFFGQ
jgi:hypothetical protein